MATLKITIANMADTAYWHPITIVGEYLEEDFLRVASHLNTPARLMSVTGDTLCIEVLCTEHAEANKTEVALRQVLADQRLRRAIAERASARIADIIDAVISKASGA